MTIRLSATWDIGWVQLEARGDAFVAIHRDAERICRAAGVTTPAQKNPEVLLRHGRECDDLAVDMERRVRRTRHGPAALDCGRQVPEALGDLSHTAGAPFDIDH